MMTSPRRHPHTEQIEAYEVGLDHLFPAQSPVLPFHDGSRKSRRILATVPDVERHKLYKGRLVGVEMGRGDVRKGSIEAVDGRVARVRMIDWDD